MDVRDLCYVEAVASTGSHTEAAHRLGVSRQAVAKGVRRVEELTDFALFSRQDGKLVPTRRGQEFIEDASGLLDVCDEFAREHLAHASQTSPFRREAKKCPPPPLIAVSGTLEPLFSTLPAAVGTLLSPCGPGLAMARGAVIDRLDSFRIVDEVSAHRYDIGIVDGLPEQVASLESLRLCAAPVYAYVPKANALANRSSLVIQDLDRQSVITPGPHSHLQRLLLARCAEAGVSVRIRAEINGCSLALEAAKGWGAVTFGLAPGVDKGAFAAVPLLYQDSRSYGIYAVRPDSGHVCASAALMWDTLVHRIGRQ